MTSIILSLLGDFWPYIVGGVGIIAVMLGLRKGGADSVRAKTAKDTATRTDKGRKAVADANADLAEGQTPEQIARNNDGKWK